MLLNPRAIKDTVGVSGTSSLKYQAEEKVNFSAACILVSWAWFFGLSLIGRMSGKLDKSGHFMMILNKISVLVMWGSSVYLVLSLFNK